MFNNKVRIILLSILVIIFIACAGKYNAKTASIQAKQTLESIGLNSVEVISVPGCYIIKKPFFMTFTAKGNDDMSLTGVIGCDESEGCEFRVFVDIMENETIKEELEELEME